MIKNLKQFLKRRKWLYAFVREFKKLREERKFVWKDAVKQFEKKEHQNGTLKDYKKAMLRQRFSYNEYVGYQLWNLRKDEIRAYISEKEMRCIYRKTVEIETFKWYTTSNGTDILSNTLKNEVVPYCIKNNLIK